MLSTTERQLNLDKAVERAREKGIILPTFAQMRDPELIPEKIKAGLRDVGLWDLNPLNLFRITWRNEAVEKGGGYGSVNYLELPSVLTGTRARIVVMLGKWFPTGAHKVGAAYGCLVPRIVSGEFNPEYHRAVWPSTGNYCRGGAFDSYLLGVTAVAILPEEMSRERFAWLKSIGAEVIATPGCESNVKEIYDKCWDIRRNRKDCVIFNQFDEFGNSCWHYQVTGHAVHEMAQMLNGTPAAYVSATGSAGTIAAGDYLKTIYPAMKIVATEALQCPTLLNNGFGGHRIEGIGDKHVPWVHNVKNTDVVTAIDDDHCMRVLRLFNEAAGKSVLAGEGLAEDLIHALPQVGISGICNIIASIKTAKHFEYTEEDMIVTVATDSAEMYVSRLDELREAKGDYTYPDAIRDLEGCLMAAGDDHYRELDYNGRKALHNLKYFTWVEQQGKTSEELNRLWYDRDFWPATFSQANEWDEQIQEFNERTGVLKTL